ncbi:uncharacterized protein LOC127240179 [Andrographis paniculata]|uniref:uncharacterized protein LOC127240179 n=1 Tax=Andrographis paniculata TaxID=175694 RepID=UPI0021E783F1|nr:uncharacterized protein LOC127240179 [Andrographis paniculata]
MADTRELGFPKTSAGNLKEQLVRTTLRNVRSQGHPYVEIREDGKKLIFYCSLCLAPCYSDSVLFNHLKGSLHTERLAAAQMTLLKPNPWPFSDGMLFFHDDSEENSRSLLASGSEQNKFLDNHSADADSLAIVNYGEGLGADASTHVLRDSKKNHDCDENHSYASFDGDESSKDLIIPAVLQKDEVSDLVVRHVGVGLIGGKFSEKGGTSNKVCSIWCEWLGKKGSEVMNINGVPEHDFSVVTFSYNYNLGRKGLLDGFTYSLPFSPYSEAEDGFGSRGKKRKSFSDPEDVSEALSNRDDSSGEESQSSNNSIVKILSGNDDQLVHSRILSSKTMRKQLRKQQRVASERACDICQQKMLPNKDVATLLNRRTGKLACSSRNTNGAFHLFHTSCLIHWLLLCEVEIYEKQSVHPKVRRRSRRKTKSKTGKSRAKHDVLEKQIVSVLCPECQGTGVDIDGEELEKPTVPLSEIFKYKIKICDARKAWMKSPQVLENCSIGFNFPANSDGTCQETVAYPKLLQFYRASD